MSIEDPNRPLKNCFADLTAAGRLVRCEVEAGNPA
jgi:hypothetical protein